MSQVQSQKVAVTVETVVPLTDSERKDIVELLEKQLGSVLLTEKITPTILGGLRVSIGDQIIDNSLRTRLDLINSGLMQHGKK